MHWRTEGRIQVVVHNHLQPTNLEWERYVNDSRENVGVENLRVLVHSQGGSPNARQRKNLEIMVRQNFRRPIPMSVLTPSLVVRAVMKLAGAFNHNIRCFPPEEVDVACVFLGLSHFERSRVPQILQSLQAELLKAPLRTTS